MEAMDALSTRFLDWMSASGGGEESHYNVSLDYGTLAAGRHGLEPRRVQRSGLRGPSRGMQGIRLVLQCVEAQHSAVFGEELRKLA
ncbi:hypothetical protein ABZP36_024985 [Zizania latifolia]